MWSLKPCKGIAICNPKAVPSFLSSFKTLIIFPDTELNPQPPTLQSKTLLVLPWLIE